MFDASCGSSQGLGEITLRNETYLKAHNRQHSHMSSDLSYLQFGFSTDAMAVAGIFSLLLFWLIASAGAASSIHNEVLSCALVKIQYVFLISLLDRSRKPTKT